MRNKPYKYFYLRWVDSTNPSKSLNGVFHSKSKRRARSLAKKLLQGKGVYLRDRDFKIYDYEVIDIEALHDLFK